MKWKSRLPQQCLASVLLLMLGYSGRAADPAKAEEKKKPICQLTLGELFEKHMDAPSRERFLEHFSLEARDAVKALDQLKVAVLDPRADKENDKIQLEGKREYVLKDKNGKDVTIKVLEVSLIDRRLELFERPQRYTFVVYWALEVSGQFKLGGLVTAEYRSSWGSSSRRLGYDSNGKPFDPKEPESKQK